MDQTAAREGVRKLIEKYEKVRDSKLISKYTEEETKKDFIQPLFELLGWDTRDKNEVSAEETISSDRVDYGFYLNGRAKFYLEAKSLRTDLHRSEYANQAVKYSWNKGVTWAVLTDFENLKVFNTQDINSSLAQKQFFDIPYSQYLERFDQLQLLSKESFANDLLDKEAERVGKKLQRLSISARLYKDLTLCRDLLTESLSQWNPGVKGDLLDEGVQKLLDRLIFLRVAEDRGIEPPTLIPLLREWQARKDKNEIPLYASMISKFRELDLVYNSNLFSEHPFEKWEEYSEATEKVIQILYGKPGYYEYDFKIIPADILGTVYENYLGYRLSKSRKGVSLDKDAGKRKEQGIYYTPVFVVDYIVRKALGPVLDRCKTIADVNKIRVLDPACGSGSFLVKALEIISEKYQKLGKEPTAATKLMIITANLYGVDLDPQAVEIARLNLLISALDARNKLPYLADTVKNGNSLISGASKDLLKYFGRNVEEKRPFDWQRQFPHVFEQGGFDVIIGNPPYVNLANIKDAAEREYYKNEFETAKNKSDLYSFFAEKAIKLLRPGGRLGFIFSNSWMGTDSFSKFRKYLLDNVSIDELVKLPADVFREATVTTILIFLTKKKVDASHIIALRQYDGNQFMDSGELSYETVIGMPGNNITFTNRIPIHVSTINLGAIAKFSMGIKTSDNKKFILTEKKDENSYPLLRGKDVGRYWSRYAGQWIWYMPKLMMEKTGAGPRRPEYFLTPKLLFREITGGGIMASYDKNNYFTNNKIHVLYKLQKYNLFFILAIVNSKFMNHWARAVFNNSFQFEVNQLEKLPIIDLDLSKSTSKEAVEVLSALAKRMTQLQEQLQNVEANSDQWHKIREEIGQTDRAIDEKVYALYGLGAAEKKSIEDSMVME